jgi:hypothetical protein
MVTNTNTHDIVPTHLAVTAMRDNGYKNAAYAIAELIDNAIQAGATQVELLCADKTELRRQRRTTQIHKIAVLDNGSGMDRDVLRMALQFGNGMYLAEEKHTGIGRFGMGLPSSSISQCRRVDVWTWQDGIENANYTYLDLDEIVKGDMRQVPDPRPAEIPDIWREVGEAFDEAGTLVVWSNIDRSLWKRSSTIIEKSEFVIGRVYRRFLIDDRAKIRFVTFDIDEQESTLTEDWARVNDPLYLMEDTSCPADPPHIPEGAAMFTEWGEPDGFDVYFRGQKHRVNIKYAIAKNEARQGQQPGARPHGKHAAKNVGVSIMRADRELEMDAGWSNPSDPRDRWWGVEIDFPPSLDDVFGVTNNKQEARYFSDLAKVDIDEIIAEGQSVSEAREEHEKDRDPQWTLYEIASTIQKNISSMRRLLRDQTAGKRRNRTRDDSPNTPEAKATEATNRRREEGYEGESDKQETMPVQEKVEDIGQGLIGLGVSESKEEAEKLAAQIVGRGLKYDFQVAGLATSPAFFDVQSRGGNIIITLNTRHPAYSRLIEVLEDDVEEVSEDELRNRLLLASDGLRLLLSAWARYEDEQPDGKRRMAAQDARWDWGRVARDFLDDDEV